MRSASKRKDKNDLLLAKSNYARHFEINTFPQMFSRNNFIFDDLEYFIHQKRKTREKERAFLLVDMQQRYFSEFSKKKLDQIIGTQMKVIDYCLQYRIPVIALEYENNGKTIEILRTKIKTVPEHEFFTKPGLDGFHKTRLADYLDSINVKETYLMGITASRCVFETALGAHDAGFRVITSEKLVADKIYDNAILKTKEYDWKIWFSDKGILLD